MSLPPAGSTKIPPEPDDLDPEYGDDDYLPPDDEDEDFDDLDYGPDDDEEPDEDPY